MHQAQPILLTYEGSKRRSLCQPSDPEFSDWTLVPESDGFRFELKQGHCPSCAVGVLLDLPDWSRDDHLHIPAAIYAGNRFECRPLSYSPRTPEADAGPNTPTLITDVPRLDVTAKQSVIRLREGDCSFPCIAVYQPRTRQGLLFGLLPNQDAEGALHVEEDLETGTCRLMLTVPGVREEKRYSHCNTQTFSGDRGRAMSAGDHLSIRYRLQSFDCHSVTELLEHLFTFRDEVYAEAPARSQLPWSEAFARVEGHYNRDFWQERARLYLCTMPKDFYPWQLGWCGGLIATWPLLASGTEESRERAQRNLEQVATQAVRPSGLLFGRANLDGEFTYDFPDDIARSWTKTWHLVRRDADVLFFGVQQWKLLQKRGEEMPALREMLTGLADAYVRVWRENGQLGQFLDTETAQIAVGNSCSGALIPAGFLRVAEAFDRPDLIPLAAEIATHYVETFLSRGYTTGGPGDALQNPDSESCAALLESLVLLYRKTGESPWLSAATQCAHLLSTWVMPGRYAFPVGSEFYRLDIETPGTVFANTQNKHSAPGLCTLSGEALLQLYRCSGDVRFLRLLESIARALPQCISLKERPIHFPCGGPLPDGWINERVNTSDWDFNVGGVFEGPCWSEVSMMLTTLELPGIYVNTSNGDLACFDHVTAEWEAGSGKLIIQNPTPYPATVTVWMDEPEQPEDCWEKITLAPGEKKVLMPAFFEATSAISV